MLRLDRLALWCCFWVIVAADDQKGPMPLVLETSARLMPFTVVAAEAIGALRESDGSFGLSRLDCLFLILMLL